jgi:hypothetical protein
MSSDTNKLIKNAAFDIITLTTIWGITLYQNDLFINFYLYKFSKFNYSYMYTKYLAFGYSVILLCKYY